MAKNSKVFPALLAAQTILALIAAPAAQALFFGSDQQAEAYKHQGDYAYETQDYPAALNYYSQAISSLPYDADQALSGLYYVRALANDVAGNYQRATDDWQQAKNCDDKLVQAAASNPQAGINVSWMQATSNQLGLLIRWREGCNPNSPDYYSDVNVRRWPANKFPLRVCVDESSGTGFGAGSRGTIMQAINQWVSANETRLRITEVDDPSQADILVQRPSPGDIARGSGGRTTYDDSADSAGNRWIKQSQMKLTCATVDFDQMTGAQRNELYNLALHESGHALGIDGHSPSGLDVMYWKSPLLKLSERDVATIRKIYP
ncbi:MAG: matrixin family metalloprotease [Cyanobacteria bacterium REEB67]|nr:matrixin family metalloprotease [Cyanobacteria bacterium REEB67]